MYLCREQLPLILLLLIFVLNKVTPPLHYLQTELKIQVGLRSKAPRFMNMQVTFAQRFRAVSKCSDENTVHELGFYLHLGSVENLCLTSFDTL